MAAMQNIFSWDNGKGPWGQPTGGKKSSNKKTTGGNSPDIEIDVDDIFRGAQDRVQRMMGGGNGGGVSRRFVMLAAFVLFGLWLLSGFYIVAPDEQGVVLRFGKYVQTTNSGLNYHLPYPIEMVIKPKVTRENIVEVGFRSRGGLQGFGWQRTSNTGEVAVKEESLMLTGDENIVDLAFTVRWKIGDAREYLFNIANPDDTIAHVAETAMREVVGRHPIDDALVENKQLIQDEAKALMQEILNHYQAGVQVNGVELQQVNPPAEVIDAFRDVQAARADNEKMQNEAKGYANDILPRARGEAAQILQDAEAYKAAKVAESEGAAQRFKSQLVEYQKAKDVTAKRLYLETMEDILQDAQKVIISGEAGQGVVPYLPLNELKKGDK